MFKRFPASLLYPEDPVYLPFTIMNTSFPKMGTCGFSCHLNDLWRLRTVIWHMKGVTCVTKVHIVNLAAYTKIQHVHCMLHGKCCYSRTLGCHETFRKRYFIFFPSFLTFPLHPSTLTSMFSLTGDLTQGLKKRWFNPGRDFT